MDITRLERILDPFWKEPMRAWIGIEKKNRKEKKGGLAFSEYYCVQAFFYYVDLFILAR